MNMNKHQRSELILLGVVVFSLIFAVLLLIIYSPDLLSKETGRSPIKWNVLISLILLVAAFAIYLNNAVLLVKRLFIQFAQHFYNLPWEDAEELVTRFLSGLQEEPPKKPILRVQEGQMDPDGPAVIYKVGGPGHLSIAHDNAVITSKMGKLCRVLGPGFYDLDPFERVWDVIDLRPQRRSLRVEFMTRDGIPAYCDADIRFRVADPETGLRSYLAEEALPTQPYRFDAEVVLKLATSKYVKSREGTGRIQDWRIGLVNGTLDGEMRNALEEHELDEFFNPRYWAMHEGSKIEEAVPPPVKPDALKSIQTLVEEKVTSIAKTRGILVETVQLGPVLPAEDAIPRQWLEFWQAKLQRDTKIYTLDEEAKRADMLEQASVSAQVEIVNSMLTRIQELTNDGIKVPPQLIVMSFMDVLRTMSDRDPAVQQLMFQQAESLMHIVNAIQKKKTPFGPVVPYTSQPPQLKP